MCHRMILLLRVKWRRSNIHFLYNDDTVELLVAMPDDTIAGIDRYHRQHRRHAVSQWKKCSRGWTRREILTFSSSATIWSWTNPLKRCCASLLFLISDVGLWTFSCWKLNLSIYSHNISGFWRCLVICLVGFKRENFVIVTCPVGLKISILMCVSDGDLPFMC